ncbi:hypothetical protein ONZ43_g6904 [Nemania bipapillata]|uniref:Uncharacterized protein n=1 Tax=Nemania bipapillata TaxID=110536 RepID=A0ACC2HVZ6_9PEZI|nr:hypothetical protein ONZ43_g6904 [Nemania bipapillata]
MRSMATPPNGEAPTSDIQILERNGKEYTEVKEGLGRILVPYVKPKPFEEVTKSVQQQQSVFYNPIQQFNRDLTILAIKAYREGLLSKSRPANTKNVAKRKRDKSSTGSPNPKKQQAQPVNNTDVSNGSQTSNVNAADEGTAMLDAKEKIGALGGDTGAPRATTNQPLPEITKELEARPKDAVQHDASRGPSFTILDALSATGLRALRYAQELPFVTSVTANDLTPSAVESIHRNVEHNGLESKIIVTLGDARAHMYSLLTEEVACGHERATHGGKNRSKGKRYNVIDLDPYGSAAPFLDAAVNAVRDDGGLLCVTCTDSSVWASNGYPEKAYSLYGGVPVKGFYSHEVGLRLILHAVATSAARYGLAIEPLLRNLQLKSSF